MKKRINKEWISNQFLWAYGKGGETARDSMWNDLVGIALTNGVQRKWEKIWPKTLVKTITSTGIKTPEHFRRWLLYNSSFTQAEISDYKKSIEINRDVAKLEIRAKAAEKREEFFKEDILPDLLYKAFLFMVSIAFVVRYIIFGVVWSIKTLKENK